MVRGMDLGAEEDQAVEGLEQEFRNFLETFNPQGYVPTEVEVDGEPQERNYMQEKVQEMAAGGGTTLFVEFEHLSAYSYDMAEKVQNQYERAEPVMRNVVRDYVRQHHPAYLHEAHGTEKQFFVGVNNLKSTEKLRELRVEKIGKLVSFSGTVTRTSEVRPELFLGTFKCQNCANKIRNVEQINKFTQPMICPENGCNNRTSFTLDKEDSIFVDWQRLKVQENVDEIPGGSLPRTMDVILRSNNTDRAKPGDRMVFTGMLAVCPDVAALSGPGAVSMKPAAPGNQDNLGEGVTGLKSLGAREMMCRLIFICSSLTPAGERQGVVNIRSDDDATAEQVLDQYGEEAAQEVLEMKERPTIYQDLAASICPSVFGHEQVKQAILLMLFGGVHKQTKEGINLRGDINVAIIGDPSTAKSQMLKYVASFLPRAVYTSGKASTAAGLTASVVKEPENNEFAIEAGALMLADNGICCIDEFDKMDQKDQVAIHEAMEQQTISIAKAGIQATLNARTSILAAANPLGGTYKKNKTLKQNIQLPPAIMSRFDLLHIMLDESDSYQDEQVARHIMELHRNPGATLARAPFKMEQLQRYIKFARSIKPRLTAEPQRALVKAFKRLRAEDATPGSSSAYRITVRQLEALIRLSEAMARVYCSEEVTVAHVHEATKLLQASILKVDMSDLELDPMEAADIPGADADLQDAVAGHDLPQHAPGAAVDADGDAPMDEGPDANAENDAAAANRAPGSQQQQQSEKVAAAAAEKQTLAATAVAAAQPEPPKPARINAKKFEFIKNLLVSKLQDVEADERPAYDDARQKAGQLAAAAEAAEAADREDAAELRAAAERAAADVPAPPGMLQKELVDHYMATQLQRKAIASYVEAEEEYNLVFKVINHLIKKEGLLVVVATPARQQHEDAESYKNRLWKERRLALAPNFTPEMLVD